MNSKSNKWLPKKEIVSVYLSTSHLGYWGKIPPMSVKISLTNRSFDGRFTLNHWVVGFVNFTKDQGWKSSFFPVVTRGSFLGRWTSGRLVQTKNWTGSLKTEELLKPNYLRLVTTLFQVFLQKILWTSLGISLIRVLKKYNRLLSSKSGSN